MKTKKIFNIGVAHDLEVAGFPMVGTMQNFDDWEKTVYEFEITDEFTQFLDQYFSNKGYSKKGGR